MKNKNALFNINYVPFQTSQMSFFLCTKKKKKKKIKYIKNVFVA